ncbi:hypothetical protein [Blastochloris sulfoviridis]|uniref:GIY-YIG domain-containing protein n=1 Tax=Blastochloris sulfoviridis TaxID=50712 RepID=A0A5M6I3U3_9HYPH|nr:hypothetical protein [Blastochloris sulfoviridis]KAA5602884.1 hypothetical protein F1193_03350 [Blastochloris sulfoviridis]
MKDGEFLLGVVAKYCNEFRHPALMSFGVFHHTIKSWRGTSESYKSGCYVYFSEDYKPLYIGKASFAKSIGDRLFAHDHRLPMSWWRENAASVTLITVANAFEAPSFEEFLIEQLRPAGNKVGAILKPNPSN